MVLSSLLNYHEVQLHFCFHHWDSDSLFDLLSVSEFGNWFHFNNLNLSMFHLCVYYAHCDPLTGLESIGQRKPIWSNGVEMEQAMFFPLVSEQQRLKELPNKQLQEVLGAFIAMALYCQRDECADHSSSSALVDKKFPIAFVNAATFRTMIKLEWSLTPIELKLEWV